MGERKRHRGQFLQGAIAALAISEVAYRLWVREPLRRTLGIQTTRHA
jgi:hypothetical protein